MPSDPVEIKYRLRIDDFHVGTGFGMPGIADSLTTKDAKGRLMIRGDTIKGIVRDAAEKLLDVCSRNRCDGAMVDNNSVLCGLNWGEDAPCPICSIFGSPLVEASFSFENCTYEAGLRQILGRLEGNNAALEFQTRIDMRNMIDRSTGRAREDHLFSHEVGRNPEGFAGCIKEIMVHVDPSVRKQKAALLVSAMRMVTHLGGSRRRGFGRCRLSIDAFSIDGQNWNQTESVNYFCTWVKEKCARN